MVRSWPLKLFTVVLGATTNVQIKFQALGVQKFFGHMTMQPLYPCCGLQQKKIPLLLSFLPPISETLAGQTLFYSCVQCSHRSLCFLHRHKRVWPGRLSKMQVEEDACVQPPRGGGGRVHATSSRGGGVCVQP